MNEPILKDVVILGGGPAGLAAALALREQGVRDLVILEREPEAGGILRQCIHDGFGLTQFHEALTGPEYAKRFLDPVRAAGIELHTGTTVTGLTAQRLVTAVSRRGLTQYQARAVILAMGCRERAAGALPMYGARPAGVFTAGVAQAYVNLYNTMVGREIVILGSGDIGLIMARRMTLEGAKVECVCEIMEHSSGLRRNIAQCLDDFGIPLYLEHTIAEIRGKERVEGVIIVKVDRAKNPIPGTEREISCDTVLFSVGLIPENELSKGAGLALDARTKGCVVDGNRETEIPGVFACGNVLHVHDLVDFVSEEAEVAGRAAADYLACGEGERAYIPTVAGENVTYVLPQRAERGKDVKLYFRVRNAFRNAVICVQAGSTVKTYKRIAVAPGEMENVTVRAADLANAQEIRVSVVREA